MARHVRPRLGRCSVRRPAVRNFRTKTPSSGDASSVSSGWSQRAGWGTTSKPTEDIIAVNCEAIHGTRLDSGKKQIRLLQILPRNLHPTQDINSSDDDTVHCQMFETCLDEKDPRPPLFNALSYAWGNPNNITNIVINEKTISVRSNLESVLRHLRDHHTWTTSGFPLWVDAVCINQKDDEEHNDQVNMMGDIYRKAHRVLAWLGEGDVDTDWLVPLLRDKAFRGQAEKADLEDDFSPGADIVRAAAISKHDLCSRAWWGRLWVSQEVILAKWDPILLIGREYVPWSDYVHLVDILLSIDDRIRRTKEYYAAEGALYARIHSDLPFIHDERDISFPGFALTRLHNFRAEMQEVGFIPMCTLYTRGDFVELSATKNVDFVYALRGLLPQEEQQLIQVDYTKTRMQVFHDAMIVAWTSSFGRHDLGEMPSRLNFCCPGSNLDEIDNVPSWVPDLSQQAGGDGTRLAMEWPETWGTIKSQISADKQTLTLRGIYFDAVSETCSVCPYWFEDDFLQTTAMSPVDLRHAAQMTSEALSRHIPPSNPLYALSGFRDSEQRHLRIPRNLAILHLLPDKGIQYEWLWRELWTKFLAGPEDTTAAVLALRQFAEEELRRRPIGLTALFCVSRFLTVLRMRLEETMVFTTEAGFIGVGSSCMQPGDRIVFPFGVQHPFVVRPLNAESARTHEYTMIGVADIAELSDRERLDAAFESGLFEEIDIHLK